MIVRWTRRFETDLRSAYDFTFERSPQGARRIATRILDSIDRLGEMPFVGRVGIKAGTRERHLRSWRRGNCAS